MKAVLVAVSGLLLLIIGGCSSHRPKQLGANVKEVAGAASVEDFEQRAMRLCPFGYDVLEGTLAHKQGEKISRYIRCRMPR